VASAASSTARGWCAIIWQQHALSSRERPRRNREPWVLRAVVGLGWSEQVGCSDRFNKRSTHDTMKGQSRMSSRQFKSLAAGVAGLLACACSGAIHAGPPRPYEVWRGGDDGLTLRFSEALTRALTASPAFTGESYGKQTRTLVVTIPTHVRWEQRGARIRVVCRVEFADHLSQPLGGASAACWEDELEDCAIAIAKKAERAARRITDGGRRGSATGVEQEIGPDGRAHG
jgi:hypothetical protein